MKKKVLDKTFVPYLTTEDIALAVERISEAINRDYAGKNPLFIAILNGSFMFASDLFKKIDIPAEITFIKLASYKGTSSTGTVVTSIGLETDLYQREIIVVEDIIDTGKTMHHFLPQIQHQQPKSLRICSLLHKKEATLYPLTIDYLGFEIPNLFVVGYGLDYDGFGRNMDQIMQIAD